jgi:hypothetical protein
VTFLADHPYLTTYLSSVLPLSFLVGSYLRWRQTKGDRHA